MSLADFVASVPGTSIGLSGLGDRPLAPSDVKQDLTARASALAARAAALQGQSQDLVGPQGDAIVAEANALEVMLNGYQPWSDFNHPPISFFGLAPTYDDSSIVRTNLQAARNNVQVAYGGRGEGWRPFQPIQSVSVWGQTAANVPGETLMAARCATEGMRYDGERCVPIDRTLCDSLPSPIDWACRHPGAVVAGLAAVILGPYVIPPLVRTVVGTARAVGS